MTKHALYRENNLKTSCQKKKKNPNSSTEMKLPLFGSVINKAQIKVYFSLYKNCGLSLKQIFLIRADTFLFPRF